MYMPNIESEHQNKLLAFKFKYIVFLQACKCLERFTFCFELEDVSYI